MPSVASPPAAWSLRASVPDVPTVGRTESVAYHRLSVLDDEALERPASWIPPLSRPVECAKHQKLSHPRVQIHTELTIGGPSRVDQSTPDPAVAFVFLLELLSAKSLWDVSRVADRRGGVVGKFQFVAQMGLDRRPKCDPSRRSLKADASRTASRRCSWSSRQCRNT